MRGGDSMGVAPPTIGSHWTRRRTDEVVRVEAVNKRANKVTVCTAGSLIVTDTPLATFTKNYKPREGV